jgi:hypothetical protein
MFTLSLNISPLLLTALLLLQWGVAFGLKHLSSFQVKPSKTVRGEILSTSSASLASDLKFIEHSSNAIPDEGHKQKSSECVAVVVPFNEAAPSLFLTLHLPSRAPPSLC